MVELPSVEGESGRVALGRTLRFLREKAGQTLGQLAEETAYGPRQQAPPGLGPGVRRGRLGRLRR
jgi:hypothetical protein